MVATAAAVDGRARAFELKVRCDQDVRRPRPAVVDGAARLGRQRPASSRRGAGSDEHVGAVAHDVLGRWHQRDASDVRRGRPRVDPVDAAVVAVGDPDVTTREGDR